MLRSPTKVIQRLQFAQCTASRVPSPICFQTPPGLAVFAAAILKAIGVTPDVKNWITQLTTQIMRQYETKNSATLTRTAPSAKLGINSCSPKEVGKALKTAEPPPHQHLPTKPKCPRAALRLHPPHHPRHQLRLTSGIDSPQRFKKEGSQCV